MGTIDWERHQRARVRLEEAMAALADDLGMDTEAIAMASHVLSMLQNAMFAAYLRQRETEISTAIEKQ
jgi:hypothetical protein